MTSPRRENSARTISLCWNRRQDPTYANDHRSPPHTRRLGLEMASGKRDAGLDGPSVAKASAQEVDEKFEVDHTRAPLPCLRELTDKQGGAQHGEPPPFQSGHGPRQVVTRGRVLNQSGDSILTEDTQ